MTEALARKVEEISSALVLSEPEDLQSLAAVHTCFEELAALAKESDRSDLAAAAYSAASLLEMVILGEAPDAAASLVVVDRAVSAIQGIAAEGRAFGEVEFPLELGLRAPRNPAAADEKILSDFLAQQEGVLQELEALTLALESRSDEEHLAGIRALLHTLKGESALLGFGDIEQLCHRSEDVLSGGVPAGAADFLLAAKDWLVRRFRHAAGRGEAPESVDEILKKLSAIEGQPAAEQGEQIVEEVTPAPVTYRALTVVPEDVDTSLLGDFVSEAREHLDAADLHLLTLETCPEDSEAINAVFRAFHTIKGVAGFLGLEAVNDVAHEAESLLDRARKGTLVLAGAVIDVVFDAADALKRLVELQAAFLATGEIPEADASMGELLERIRAAAAGQLEASTPAGAEAGKPVGQLLVERGVASEAAISAALKKQAEAARPRKLGELLVDAKAITQEKIASALCEQEVADEAQKLGEILTSKGEVSAEAISAALVKQVEPRQKPLLGEILVKEEGVPAGDVARALRSQKPTRSSTGFINVKNTVKVDAERLDRLVDAIGELVIAESMVSQSAREGTVNGSAGKLLSQLSQLDKITRELQEMGTGLRMVPVRATFQKMARLVRDLAKKSGKRVNFSMTGEDTELDKSVVDQIGDPLVHMVRNAVDHGIEESPEARRAAGKGPDGRIQLRAYHKGGNIYIEIVDDGRGLDREKLLAKARERGLISGGEGMSDREVFNLIFEPGFSTAAKVTAVSGRGVGMDVVRRNVEALHGQVEIRSEKGKGSTITMRLPLTLAIIDGMVVGVASDRYIIPTLSIVRSVRPEAGQIETVLGRGEMLKLHGSLLPLFRMHQLFTLQGAESDATRALAVVVEDDGKQTALLVDELLGQQQIVIKSLGGALQGTPGLSGGAIMPDGAVGLILDVSGLVRMAHQDGAGAGAKGGDVSEAENTEPVEVGQKNEFQGEE
jgi:two-component system, chemotaxis family, sensor kinase CheA